MNDIELTALDASQGVPDTLYIALMNRCDTSEECMASRVLRFHRDWLNGGFGQVFDNLSDEPLDDYVEAYRAVGLNQVVTLINEAFSLWNNGELSDEQLDDLEQLDDRCSALTYGESGEDPDQIEKTLVEYIRANSQAFASAGQRAALI